MTRHRLPHARIDELQSRFRVLRHRAQTQGAGMAMSWEGYSWLMLKACGVGPAQLILILQPLQQRLPNNEADFEQMLTIMRRMGHVNEGSQGNIGSHFSNHGRGHYMMFPGTDGTS